MKKKFKVIVSMFSMHPGDEDDTFKHTKSIATVAPSHCETDGKFTKATFEYDTPGEAQAVVNALFGGSLCINAVAVPDWRGITLMRWMTLYPNTVLIFQHDKNTYIIPIDQHQKVCKESGHITSSRLQPAMAEAIANGYKVMVLDVEATPDPNPGICSCCGKFSPNAHDDAWYTTGHPLDGEGYLPYPICEGCKDVGIIKEVLPDGMGTLVLNDNPPEQTGYHIRTVGENNNIAEKKVVMYWTGKGWSHDETQRMDYPTVRDVRRAMAARVDVFKNVVAVSVAPTWK